MTRKTQTGWDATSEMVVRCPAKVNLFLAVGPKDDIGYHPLRTVFQAIGLFDELRIEVADRDKMTCNWDELPLDNTVTKAVRLLREFGDVPPLRMHLEKSIPSQAGLGGGSSDAAGFLRAVNGLSATPFNQQILNDVACAVGADVPFFLVGGRVRGEGYGDKLTPEPDSIAKWLTIVKPENVSCSTVEAYRRLDDDPRPFREFPEFDDDLHNDFERVMPNECKDWTEHLRSLGAKRVLLCGSGSAVFGMFDSEAESLALAEGVRKRGKAEVWVAPTLNRAESLKI